MMELKKQILALTPTCDYQLWLDSSWGLHFTINAEQLWPAASLIKLGITAYAQAQANPGELLHLPVELTKDDIVGGAGTLQFLTPRHYLTSDLLQLMLLQSDNTATNALLSTWGFDSVQAFLQQNYPQVHLARKLMKPAVHGDNVASATGLGQVWQDCFAHHDEYGQLVRQSLHHQQNQTKLVWPVSASEFAQIKTFNKTGEIPHYEHDAARFSYEGKWVDCIVMTHFDRGQRVSAITFMQEIGRLICRVLLG